ncbi:unnamed protein product [Chondrus crispus]|uniref:Uncharacterized protein n=1 Tax=Chondrus crispus TaxID=2769 RepID=R7QCB3_CHOCR|nr:unnamed protein product [Chondrus crispus]CDF35100.1 unnamed protein product [Chondrus crispus]|eukprot:XP_005714919.1 unnamed protein product [Chondrus crispus]
MVMLQVITTTKLMIKRSAINHTNNSTKLVCFAITAARYMSAAVYTILNGRIKGSTLGCFAETVILSQAAVMSRAAAAMRVRMCWGKERVARTWRALEAKRLAAESARKMPWRVLGVRKACTEKASTVRKGTAHNNRATAWNGRAFPGGCSAA